MTEISMGLSGTFCEISIKGFNQEDLEVMLMFRGLSPEEQMSILRELQDIEECTKPEAIEVVDNFLAPRNWKSQIHKGVSF